MNRKNSAAKLILLALEKTVDGCVLLDDFSSNSWFYAQGFERINKPALSMALKRLRENGFVELLSDDELTYRLTDLGRTKALWTKMKLENEEWDGKWRFVIWDIPEKRRKARDLLRFQLKQLGFTKCQQSVWVSKKSCTELLEKYINDVGISNWVHIIETERKELNLK